MGGGVHRPFQYLGTKLRALDAIVKASEGFAEPAGVIVDLFTGSTVVAQAFALQNRQVAAYDALGFPAITARAILGVGRRTDELMELGRAIVGLATQSVTQSALVSWVKAEDDALASSDGDRLLTIGHEIPQIWRPAGATGKLRAVLARVAESTGRPSSLELPLASTHYAGTYFGVRQSVLIDGLRDAIERLAPEGWVRAACLAGLASALSRIAFTAGKHFAQPHKTDPKKDLTFHRRRALSDRSINVVDAFLEALAAIDASPLRDTDGHYAEHATLEELLTRISLGQIGMIYADPPYTAQQYSRFYHVPEVILHGMIPGLQARNGSVTAGLYPQARFKSRFCSKRFAGDALRDLFRLAEINKAPLMISYAASATGHSGNDRMLSLETITDGMRSRGFTDVDVVTIEHNYRQLNHRRNAVVGRTDREYLVVGKPAC